jgi:hypothetical protein
MYLSTKVLGRFQFAEAPTTAMVRQRCRMPRIWASG